MRRSQNKSSEILEKSQSLPADNDDAADEPEIACCGCLFVSPRKLATAPRPGSNLAKDSTNRAADLELRSGWQRDLDRGEALLAETRRGKSLAR